MSVCNITTTKTLLHTTNTVLSPSDIISSAIEQLTMYSAYNHFTKTLDDHLLRLKTITNQLSLISHTLSWNGKDVSPFV